MEKYVMFYYNLGHIPMRRGHVAWTFVSIADGIAINVLMSVAQWRINTRGMRLVPQYE